MPQVPKIRHALDGLFDHVSRETGLKCEDPSKTIQSQKDESDINNIVAAFGVTGQLPQGVRAPQYGDFDQVYDYQTAIAAVRQAENSFMQMPPQVRERFHNNPGAFVEFCSKPENLPEMRAMGLAVSPATGTPEAPSGVSPAAGSEKTSGNAL